MGWFKKDVIPLLMHWSYVFLALTCRNHSTWNWVLFNPHNQYHGWWCPRYSRSQGMNIHAIDLVPPESLNFSPRSFKIQKHSYLHDKLVHFPEIKCKTMLDLLSIWVYLWTWLFGNKFIYWRCHFYVMRHCFFISVPNIKAVAVINIWQINSIQYSITLVY